MDHIYFTTEVFFRLKGVIDSIPGLLYTHSPIVGDWEMGAKKKTKFPRSMIQASKWERPAPLRSL